VRNHLFSLVILFCCVGSFKAQTTIYAAAPVATGTTNSYAPTGFFTSEFLRNCFLFKASELSTFTSSLITGIGFSLSAGASMPVNGTVQIYMQNTNDNIYTKGTSYPGIISPMTQVYSGNMLIPSNTNTASTMITLNTPFNYTGGGIYVALNWVAASTITNVVGSASYYRDISSSGNMGAYKASTTSGAALNTLQQTSVRPVYISEGQNASTNEASVTGLTAPGIVAEAINAPHLITARIKNGSNTTLFNKQVFLNVTGANPFTNTQVIPSFSAGATATVVFAPYTPTALGMSTIDVSLPNDNINSNNLMSWPQVVTCNSMGYFSTLATFGPELGYNNNGRIYSCRYNFPVTTTLTQAKFAFANGAVGAFLYGTLQNSSGLIIATTNTSQPIASYETYTFTTPQILNANTDYFVGLAQPLAGIPGITVYNGDNALVPGRFFVSPPNGGSLGAVTNYYFDIQAILAGPEISINPTSALICSGEAITLVASGGATYTWSSVFNPLGNANTMQVTVTPTSSEIYTLSAKDNAGCVAFATVQVDVDACVGIKNNVQHVQAAMLYPNPTEDGLAFVSGLTGPSHITVFNILGEVLLDKWTNEDKVVIDLKAQPSGNYVVKVNRQDSNAFMFKLIKP
jgi:hypothetical protein